MVGFVEHKRITTATEHRNKQSQQTHAKLQNLKYTIVVQNVCVKIDRLYKEAKQFWSAPRLKQAPFGKR
jgi:predicted GTPase